MPEINVTCPQKTLLCFEVRDSKGVICLISDYSLASATSQATDEVAEAFDINDDEIRVQPAESTRLYRGKPAYQHILACSHLQPQRILDMR